MFECLWDGIHVACLSIISGHCSRCWRKSKCGSASYVNMFQNYRAYNVLSGVIICKRANCGIIFASIAIKQQSVVLVLKINFGVVLKLLNSVQSSLG